MPRGSPIPELTKPGDVLTSSLINMLIREVNRLTNIGVGPGLNIQNTQGGVFLSLSGSDSCSPRNERLFVVVLGQPDSGSFGMQLTVNGTEETITINLADNAATIQAAIEGHSEVGEGNVYVTGGDLPDNAIVIEFVEDLGKKHIATPSPVNMNDLVGGTGVGVIIYTVQTGHPGEA